MAKQLCLVANEHYYLGGNYQKFTLIQSSLYFTTLYFKTTLDYKIT